MNPDTTAITTKKKNRLLKEQRRRHPEISKEIILLWEELRQKSVKSERKYEICEKIVKSSKIVMIELIKQKTTARVFETVIEFGSEEHRWTIFEIVKSDLLELSKGKYSYFVIVNMLKYGTKEQRLSVFRSLKGHVVELLTHSHASKVVETAYNEVATSSQRREMVQEFYGKTFVLFKGEKEISALSDITSDTKFDLSILRNLHDALVPVLRKSLVDLSLVQRVLLEYLEVLVKARAEHVSTGSSNQYGTLVDEIVELVVADNQILKLCNTREGTKVAMIVFWQCANKERKKVLQAVKEVAVGLAVSDNSHLFLLAILDQMDDVKAVDKYLLQPIMSQLATVCANVNGRKIVQFMMNGKHKRFFATATLDLLAKGEGNLYSKKDADIRMKEILGAVKKPLLNWLLANIDHALNYSTSMNLATSVLTQCLPGDDEKLRVVYNDILSRVALNIDEAMVPISGGNKRKLKDTDVVAKKKKKSKNFAGKFDGEENEEAKEEETEEVEEKIDTHLLESSGGQVLTRSLLKLEKEKKIEGFSALVVENLHVENLKTFISCNRTAFFLVNLYETDNKEAQIFLRENLKSEEKKMAQSGLQGVKILYKHIFQL